MRTEGGPKSAAAPHDKSTTITQPAPSGGAARGFEEAPLLEDGDHLLADLPHGPGELGGCCLTVAALEGLQHPTKASSPHAQGVGDEAEELAGQQRRHG